MDSFDPQRQIRVLVLDPGMETDPISSTFNIIDLHRESRPPHILWEALSYTWSSAGDSRDISVDARIVQIPYNVFRMLRSLRLPDRARRLWIDALCIDQTDEKEKAKQVQLMGRIYQEAYQAVIWLDCQGKVAEAVAVAIVAAVRWTDDKLKVVSSLPSHQTLSQAFIVERDVVLWGGAFHEILHFPWFGRMWVVQEAALARRLCVHLYNDTLSWDLFASTALMFMSLLPASRAIREDMATCYAICKAKSLSGGLEAGSWQGLESIHLILSLRQWLQSADVPVPLSEVALLCRGRYASKQQDMIYGIRGFLTTRQSLRPMTSFPVDYALSPREVYKRFVTWSIQQEGNLDILAQMRNEQGVNRGIPSWATNWSTKSRLAFESTSTIPMLERLQHNIWPIVWKKPKFHVRGDTLILEGYVLDDLVETWESTGWTARIPNDPSANTKFFGEENPSNSTLDQIRRRTVELNSFTSHLWRDGRQAHLQVREPHTEFWGEFLTKRDLLALTFPYFDYSGPHPKICYLLGGRGLFVLAPANHLSSNQPQQYRLICGDCFIDGFEDGKGLAICKSLRLKKEDIRIV